MSGYDNWKTSNPYDDEDVLGRQLSDEEHESHYADMMEDQKKLDVLEQQEETNKNRKDE
jgi:hypothetical protein